MVAGSRAGATIVLVRDLHTASHCPHCGAPLGVEVPHPDGRERAVCPECRFVLYLGPKVAAGTIPVVDGRLVLIKRGVPPRIGFWSFPCGYVEYDETIQQAAIRETREECGLEVEIAPAGMIGCYSYAADAQAPLGLVITAFHAEVVGGELQAGDDAEDVRLVEPNAVPWDDLAFRSSHAAINDWLAGRR